MSFSQVLIFRCFAVLCLCVLIFAGSVIYQIATDFPKTRSLEMLTITPDETDPVIIGRRALLQPKNGPVVEHHFAVLRRPNQSIVVYDIASNRKVGFTPVEGSYDDTSRIEIPEGETQLRIGSTNWSLNRQGSLLEIQPVQPSCRYGSPPTKVSLRPSEVTYHQAQFDGNTALISKVDLFTFYSGRWLGDLYLSYRMGGEAGATIQTALDERILPTCNLPRDAARLIYSTPETGLLGGSVFDFAKRLIADGTQGAWFLAPGRRPVQIATGGTGVWLDPQAQPIEVVSGGAEVSIRRLVIGRTYYDVSFEPSTTALRFRPVSRNARIAPGDIEAVKDPRVARQLTPTSSGISISGLKAAVILAVLVAATSIFVQKMIGRPGLGAVALAGAGLALVISSNQGIWTAFSTALWTIAGLLFVAWIAPLIRKATSLFWQGGSRANRPTRSFFSSHNFLVFLVGVLAAAAMVTNIIGEASTTMVANKIELGLVGTGLSLFAPFMSRKMPLNAAIVWVLFTYLAAFGTAAGLRLTLLEPTDAYGRLFETHLLVIAGIGLVASLIIGLFASDGAAALNRLTIPKKRTWIVRWSIRFLMGAAGLALVVLTALGDETGFFGVFQPSEASKSVLVILVALTVSNDLARRTMLNASEGALSLWMVFWAAIFAAAILVTSALNYDMSPIIVSGLAMLVTLIAGVVLHRRASRQQRFARRWRGLPIPKPVRPLWATEQTAGNLRMKRLQQRLSRYWPLVAVSVILGAVGIVGIWSVMNESFREGGSFTWYKQLLTPWLRLQSFYDMRLAGADKLIDFPQIGTQLRNGREALLVAECHWVEAPCPASMIEVAELEKTRLLLRVPAVQDDFAAVSLIHGIGLDGGIAYFCGQISLIGAAVWVGITSLRLTGPRRISGWILGCSVLGMTALFGAQILTAWANVLGILPIMGQPMTFVSFGGSHHLGVALPFVIVTLAACCLSSGSASGLRALRVELLRRRDFE